MKVFYISNINDLRDKFVERGHEYRFFDYSSFYEQDNILGMWSRLFTLLDSIKPELILLNFKHPNMINDNEIKTLSKFGIVLMIHNG